eukprot:CAMPEP_0184485404 /NCGR_PEP_ID=MMETSP0113_2-20130426/7005_1 /TAXON_ID=91329 /ORGANISM="Norrisiella sphaerica, Strain BC52" /LENGTH=1165 /DNA_ID=CAMNT_0026866833 /DNA_START=262 /DNA_END=3759 /DNA_ORIENTATION=+
MSGEPSYSVGQDVEVWSLGKKKWFKDGKIVKIKKDGSVKVHYSRGKGIMSRGSKWINPSEIKKFLRHPSRRKDQNRSSDNNPGSQGSNPAIESFNDNVRSTNSSKPQSSLFTFGNHRENSSGNTDIPAETPGMRIPDVKLTPQPDQGQDFLFDAFADTGDHDSFSGNRDIPAETPGMEKPDVKLTSQPDQGQGILFDVFAEIGGHQEKEEEVHQKPQVGDGTGGIDIRQLLDTCGGDTAISTEPIQTCAQADESSKKRKEARQAEEEKQVPDISQQSDDAFQSFLSEMPPQVSTQGRMRDRSSKPVLDWISSDLSEEKPNDQLLETEEGKEPVVQTKEEKTPQAGGKKKSPPRILDTLFEEGGENPSPTSLPPDLRSSGSTIRVYRDDGTWATLVMPKDTSVSKLIKRAAIKLYGLRRPVGANPSEVPSSSQSTTEMVKSAPSFLDSNMISSLVSNDETKYLLLYTRESQINGSSPKVPELVTDDYFQRLRESPGISFHLIPRPNHMQIDSVSIKFSDGVKTRVFVGASTTVTDIIKAGSRWRKSRSLSVAPKYELYMDGKAMDKLEEGRNVMDLISYYLGLGIKLPSFNLIDDGLAKSKEYVRDDSIINRTQAASDIYKLPEAKLIMPTIKPPEERKKSRYGKFTDHNDKESTYSAVVHSSPFGLSINQDMRVVVAKELAMAQGIMVGDKLLNVNGTEVTFATWKQTFSSEKVPFRLSLSRTKVPITRMLDILKQSIKMPIVKSRWHRMKNWALTFHGDEFLTWLEKSKHCESRCEAEGLGLRMIQCGLIRRIDKPHDIYSDTRDLFQAVQPEKTILHGSEDIKFDAKSLRMENNDEKEPLTLDSISLQPDPLLFVFPATSTTTKDGQGDPESGVDLSHLASSSSSPLPSKYTVPKYLLYEVPNPTTASCSWSPKANHPFRKREAEKIPKIGSRLFMPLITSKISKLHRRAYNPMQQQKKTLPPAIFQALSKIWVDATKDIEDPSSVGFDKFVTKLSMYFGIVGEIAPRKLFSCLADRDTRTVSFENWLNGVTIWEFANLSTRLQILFDIFNRSQTGFLSRSEVKELVLAVSRQTVSSICVVLPEAKRESFFDSCTELAKSQLDDYMSFFSNFFAGMDADMDNRVSLEDLREFLDITKGESALSLPEALRRLVLPMDVLYCLRC